MIQNSPAIKVWWRPAELAAERLPGLPTTARAILKAAEKNGWKRPGLFRFHRGQGGGIEFKYLVLPEDAQRAILAKGVVAPSQLSDDPRPSDGDRDALWAWFGRQTKFRKNEGKRRVAAVARIEQLRGSRIGRPRAIAAVCAEMDVAPSTVHGWLERLRGVDRADWLAALTPQARGGKRTKIEVDEQVWNAFRADYLTLSQPAFDSSYRRIAAIAAAKGWPMPAARTLRRRVDDIPAEQIVLARKGFDALKRMIPPQQRTRAHFHALQAVNADGHKWDVFVRWPDGTIGRPLTLAWQDLFSGKFLAWRTAKSESQDVVRLSFGDMIRDFGIPDTAYLDNGRAFASKKISGGTSNRFRFKAKDDEIAGIITQMGVTIHWTTPYAGQSKPIERGFRDFANDIARHPAFVGAYCGNSPMAKPENYGDRAIPIVEFLRIIDREIAAHNARPGRRSEVCAGVHSFDQVFDASVAQSLIRKGTVEQVRLCLLAAEAVLVRPTDGTINLFGNSYWNEALWEHRGKKVAVRFDPDHLKLPVLVSKLDGTPICEARVRDAVGFDDTDAARTHNQARAAIMRSVKERAKAEAILSLADLAKLQPDDAVSAPRAEPAAVRPFRPLTRGNLALQPAFEPEHTAEIMDFDERLQRGLARARAAEAGD